MTDHVPTTMKIEYRKPVGPTENLDVFETRTFSTVTNTMVKCASRTIGKESKKEPALCITFKG